jgi:GntR family transcriptional repressor for pyruvate dehydrogenase complex
MALRHRGTPPMTPFSPVRSPRLSEVIIRQIAQFVEAGRMQINDRFPSERALEIQWKVSRPVLREAFRALEMQGMIETVRAAGAICAPCSFPNRRHTG